jgi:hypothetical protein
MILNSIENYRLNCSFEAGKIYNNKLYLNGKLISYKNIPWGQKKRSEKEYIIVVGRQIEIFFWSNPGKGFEIWKVNHISKYVVYQVWMLLVIVWTNMWGNMIYVKDQNKHKLWQQMKPGLKCKIEFNE